MKRAIAATTVALLLLLAITATGGTPRVAAATQMFTPSRVLDTRDGTGVRQGRLDAGETLTLRLANVAANRTVMMNLTAVGADVPGFVTAWPCGQPKPATSVLNFEPGRAIPNMVALAHPSAGLCFESSSAVHLVADLTGVADAADVAGVAPQRLLDTRSGARVAAATERRLRVAGTPGIAAGATAAVLNVTVVLPVAAGFVSVKPCGATTNASTVNFFAGEVVAHLTFTALGGGDVCLYSSAATHLLVDSFGYVPNGSVRAVTPARLLDTRIGLGGTTGKLASGQTARLQVSGRGNVPDGAAGATVNVVAIEGQGDGFVTLWPCGPAAPLASTLNLWPGMARSNQATIEVSDTGELCIRAFTANGTGVHVVLDVVGYVADAGTANPGTTTTTIDPYSTTTVPTGGSGGFPTLPVGASLPSGAQCAARVRDAAEIRPENAAANANRGGRQYANSRTDWAGFNRVDGDFAGTTDEIIQWAACKWGIDEDIVRAQIIKESYWYMSTVGDGGDSFGVGQVRRSAHGSAFQFPQVNAQNSTAYNLDYTYASWRACYEGVYGWLNQTSERNGTYGPGDVWGCLGVWFSGRWYWNNDAYLNQQGDSVRWHYDNRTWLTPQFING